MRIKQVGHTQGLSSGAPVFWPEPTGWPERPLKPGITPTRHHAWPSIMPSACWAAPSRCHVLGSRHCLRIREGLYSRLPSAHGCSQHTAAHAHAAAPRTRRALCTEHANVARPVSRGQPREDNVARPVPRHVLGSLRRPEPIWRHYRVQAWGFQANARNRRISGNSSGSMP